MVREEPEKNKTKSINSSYKQRGALSFCVSLFAELSDIIDTHTHRRRLYVREKAKKKN